MSKDENILDIEEPPSPVYKIGLLKLLSHKDIQSQSFSSLSKYKNGRINVNSNRIKNKEEEEEKNKMKKNDENHPFVVIMIGVLYGSCYWYIVNNTHLLF